MVNWLHNFVISPAAGIHSVDLPSMVKPHIFEINRCNILIFIHRQQFINCSMKKIYLLLIGFCLSFVIAEARSADTIPQKRYDTRRLAGSNITLDGIPDEEAWNIVEWAGNFTQWQPNDGAPASQPYRF